MAELLEYSLAFLVSVLFVAGSVATYDSFSAYISSVQFSSSSSAIMKLANQAMASGGASGSVTVPLSTIACSNGTLSFASGGRSEQTQVRGACGFFVDLSGGFHTITFTYHQTLTVRVT